LPIASVAVASFVIAGIFAGVGVLHRYDFRQYRNEISVTHLDGYFSSYQLNKSQYVKLLGLGLIDFLVTNPKLVYPSLICE
jgi:hypothetical protein